MRAATRSASSWLTLADGPTDGLQQCSLAKEFSQIADCASLADPRLRRIKKSTHGETTVLR